MLSDDMIETIIQVDQIPSSGLVPDKKESNE